MEPCDAEGGPIAATSLTMQVMESRKTSSGELIMAYRGANQS
jgi:hypothetical protein